MPFASMLRNSGFREIRVGATVFDLEEQISEPDTDLVISEIDLTGGDLCELVRRVRHHRTRANPFLPFIARSPANRAPNLSATSWMPESTRCSPSPCRPSSFRTALFSLIRARKPFVVTSDYIGPDRRGDDERESEVRADRGAQHAQDQGLSAGGVDSEVQARIDAMIAKINLQKIERNQDFLSWVIAELAPPFNAGIYTPDYGAPPGARDGDGRGHPSPGPRHQVRPCRRSVPGADRGVLGNPRKPRRCPKRRSLLLIQPLGQAIEKGFESGTADAARGDFPFAGRLMPRFPSFEPLCLTFPPRTSHIQRSNGLGVFPGAAPLRRRSVFSPLLI